MNITLPSTLAALCCASILSANAQEKAPPEKPAEATPAAILKLEDLLKGATVKPLAIPEKSISSREFRRQMFEWVKRTVRPAIDREVKDVPDASKIVDRLLAWWCSQDQAVDLAALLTDARKLAAPSANLPMTQFFIAELCSAEDADDEALLRWSISSEQSDAAKMPPWPGMLAAARLLYHESADEPQELRFFLNLHATIKPEHCTDADSPFIVHILLGQLSGLLETRASKLVVTFSEAQMPEWARLAILGDIHIHLAWEARGSGWGSSVTREGGKKFAEHLGKAREALVKSWELRPDRPEAASRMITVMMGGQAMKDETKEMWLTRAITAEFDHADAYQRMLNALLPRWGGSHGRMLALGLSAAAAGKNDSDLADVLPNALMMIAREAYSWRNVYRTPVIANPLVAARRGQIESAKNDTWKEYYRGMLAIEAWMAGDFGASAMAFDQLKKSPANLPTLPDGPRALAGRLGFDWVLAFDESHAFSGKWADDYRRAAEALESNRFGEAEALAKKIETGAGAPELIASLPERITFERALGKSEWLALPQRRALWWDLNGSWETAGPLRAVGGDEQAIRLLRTQLGGRYEVRGKARLPRTDGECGFGFAVGHPTEYDRGAWIEAYLGTADGKATTFQIIGQSEEFAKRKKGEPGPELGEDRVVSFRIRRDNDYLSWWVNDKPLIEKQELPRRLPNGDCAFGFTAWAPGGKEAVTFTDLEIRQLGEKD